MFVFELPEIGEGVVEGEIVQWLKQPGERVVANEPLVEVMTDKATVEIPSPATGTVQSLKADEGDICPVGDLIALIEEGDAPATTAAPAAAAPAPMRRQALAAFPPPMPSPALNLLSGLHDSAGHLPGVNTNSWPGQARGPSRPLSHPRRPARPVPRGGQYAARCHGGAWPPGGGAGAGGEGRVEAPPSAQAPTPSLSAGGRRASG